MTSFPKDHNFLIGEIPAQEIVKEFGSPLYAYDAVVLRNQYKAVSGALGPRVRILQCLKANPNAAIAALFRRAGAGAEVASAGEIHLALAAGHAGKNLHFAGPGKSMADLTRSSRVGLGCLNLESAAEYQALVEVCHREKSRPGVAIRVNPKAGIGGSRMQMGGGSKKFGVDVEQVHSLAARIIKDDVVDLLGLHIYVGTQCFAAQAWLGNAAFLLEFANDLEARLNYPLRGLNFGGGFGIPYYPKDPTFDLDEAGEGLQELIRQDDREDRSYFVELGRYLVAPAGFYLTRVVYLKESQGKHHAILDGGLHQHSAAAGVGSVIRRAFPLVYCGKSKPESCRPYTLGGPLCSPADEFGVDVELPELNQGDLLVFKVSGAYGLTFSNVNFLSHPTCGEVLVAGNQAVLVREPGGEEDALRGQIIPEKGV